LCEQKIMESQINSQLWDKAMKLCVIISHCKAKETADLIMKAWEENPKLVEIELLGRGKLISRAVDVAEIMRRALGLYDIKSGTLRKDDGRGESCNISEIRILFKRGRANA